MRTPKDIRYEYGIEYHVFDEDVKSIQDEAYNQALADAVMELEHYIQPSCHCSLCTSIRNIKLKKK